MTMFAILPTDDFNDVADVLKNRDEYLAWIEEWRVRYAALTHEIRTMKAARKPFLYAYRTQEEAQATPTPPKRTKVGDNPSYDQGAAWQRNVLREEAEMMMHARKVAKAKGIARMQAERENVAA